MTYKATKVLKFPEVWREHQRLLREKVELTERARRLNEEAVAAAAHVVEPDSSDSDSDGSGNDPSLQEISLSIRKYRRQPAGVLHCKL